MKMYVIFIIYIYIYIYVYLSCIYIYIIYLYRQCTGDDNWTMPHVNLTTKGTMIQPDQTQNRGVLGTTSSLERRASRHRKNLGPGPRREPGETKQITIPITGLQSQAGVVELERNSLGIHFWKGWPRKYISTDLLQAPSWSMVRIIQIPLGENSSSG